MKWGHNAMKSGASVKQKKKNGDACMHERVFSSYN